MPSAEARHRGADAARDVARLRERDRPLHAAAAGGLAGQTFEIEVAAGTESGRPIFTRGYVTITDLVTPGRPGRRSQAWFDALEEGLARLRGRRAARGARGRAAAGRLRPDHAPGALHGQRPQPAAALRRRQGGAVRAAGTWDPMPWHLDRAYRIAGRDAQHAFWGQGDVARLSLLHQLAERIARVTDAVVIGSGPERARRRDPARRGRARRSSCSRRRTSAGGAVRTEELTLPGFRHDTFSSVYPAAAASPVFARMPLADHGLRMGAPRGLLGASAARAATRPCSTATCERTAESLDRQHPATATPGSEFAAPFVDAFDAVRATMLAGFPPLGGPLRLLRQRRSAAACWSSRGWCPESAVGLAGRLFEGRRLARVALRRGDARRHAAAGRRQRDRRRLPQPARSRGRLAEPARRGAGADRRARRLPARASAARSAPARRSSACSAPAAA